MVKGIDYALVVPIEIHITPFARPENSFEQYLSIIKKKIFIQERLEKLIVVVVVVVFISHSCSLGFRIFYISFTFGVLFFLK